MAYFVVFDTTVNKILHLKMEHGRDHEALCPDKYHCLTT